MYSPLNPSICGAATTRRFTQVSWSRSITGSVRSSTTTGSSALIGNPWLASSPSRTRVPLPDSTVKVPEMVISSLYSSASSSVSQRPSEVL